MQSPPYLMLATPEEEHEQLSGNDRYEGFCADLASLLAERLHISYVLRPVIDGKYGGQEPNGSWNGMVGELIYKVVQHAVFLVLVFVYVFTARRCCGACV